MKNKRPNVYQGTTLTYTDSEHSKFMMHEGLNRKMKRAKFASMPRNIRILLKRAAKKIKQKEKQ